jgi:ketosteroid isomerase-like protein
MSEQGVEVVVGLFEAVNSRDFAAAMDAYADDAVLALHGDLRGLSGAEVVSGKKAVGDWFADWFRQFASDYRFEIDETRDWGDRVFLIATHHGRGRASGAPISMRTAYIYELRDGKIVRCDCYASRGEALGAAGVSE